MPSYLQERHAVIQSFMPLPKTQGAPLQNLGGGGQLPPCPPSSAATASVVWDLYPLADPGGGGGGN